MSDELKVTRPTVVRLTEVQVCEAYRDYLIKHGVETLGAGPITVLVYSLPEGGVRLVINER